jgi:hypothetical protein
MTLLLLLVGFAGALTWLGGANYGRAAQRRDDYGGGTEK